jgi:hypothetical protein
LQAEDLTLPIPCICGGKSELLVRIHHLQGALGLSDGSLHGFDQVIHFPSRESCLEKGKIDLLLLCKVQRDDGRETIEDTPERLASPHCFSRGV